MKRLKRYISFFASGALALVLLLAVHVVAPHLGAQQPGRNLVPLTEDTLKTPSPNDWLMYNRTYDAQRFSPLQQINKSNVGQLKLAWSVTEGAGSQEGIPLVHDGVMYLQSPGAVIQAYDAATGQLIWEHKRNVPQNIKNGARAKTIAIGFDMVYWTSPDSYLEALDARTGELRWEAKTETRGATQGAIVAGDKVISGGACGGKHENCFIDAHDAKTGKLLWKFMTAAETGQLGGDTWGGLPDDKRVAGPWGLSGTYDPSTNAVIWGVANPTPNSRLERHGDFNAIPTHAPADLFSNSTISLNADTGKLNWYYQHLPGDDWDEDWTNDRILVTTALNPTRATAKWFNSKIKAGERRDIVLATGESGGVFALDRHTGEFLWANPWPYDVPNFFLKNIDEKGITYLNESAMLTHPNMTNTVCFFNTRSFWSQGYSPLTNSLYTPFVDACNEEKIGELGTRSNHNGVVRDPSKLDELSGVSKINAATGKIDHIFKGPGPINGAMLLTAGNLLFFGDLAQHFRALDQETGKVLWDEELPGPIANSTITYAVNGRQFVAVYTGDGQLTASVAAYNKALKSTRRMNTIQVFALPEDVAGKTPLLAAAPVRRAAAKGKTK
ncbi:MAG TPA: PQQ-binding-like beta-propeller repeat protein [Bryobacteraceae bacterium]|nr:PQQ-binding-like beta-propeller repeat protein [Bryobacteraceae bacterium]